MTKTFNAIKSNPMDLNRIMDHVALLSSAVDLLICDAIGDDYMYKLHTKMLGTPPLNYHKPHVQRVSHWENLGKTVKAGHGIDLSQIHPDNLLFWSDTHFGHKKIIEFSNRPFANLDHMHDEMAKRFAAVTKPGDVVVWCGDISFVGSVALREIMKRYKHTYNILVVGNHDIDRDGRLRKPLEELFDEIHVTLTFGKYVVTHHPWTNMLPPGMVNIHGHMHDRPFSMKDHLCACVELTNYAPVSLSYLIDKGIEDEFNRQHGIPIRVPTMPVEAPEAPTGMDYFKSVAHQFIEPKK